MYPVALHYTFYEGGIVTSAGWQATLCDPMWHVSSRSGVATLRTAIHLLLMLEPQRPAVAGCLPLVYTD